MYSQNARRRAHTRSPRRVVARFDAGAAAVARVSRASSRTHGPVARRFETKSHTRTYSFARVRIRAFVRSFTRRALADARCGRRACSTTTRRSIARVARCRRRRRGTRSSAATTRGRRAIARRAARRRARSDGTARRREGSARRRAREARTRANERSGRACAWRTCWRARGRRKRR